MTDPRIRLVALHVSPLRPPLQGDVEDERDAEFDRWVAGAYESGQEPT